MFYRMLQGQFSPEKFHEIVALIESKREEFVGLAGVKSATFVQTGAAEAVMIGVYESEEAYNAISETVNAILAQVVPLLDGPPTVVSGTAVWEAKA